MKVYVEENDIKRKIVTYHNGINTQQGLYVYGKDKIEVLFLADYTKQVKKEMCDNFRKIAMQYYTTDDKGNLILTCNDVWDILSKIQGEDK